MENLWAPWRQQYIKMLGKKSKPCVFCRIVKQVKRDRENFVVSRTTSSFSVLNIYPYNNGHLLVLPNRHVNDLAKLSHDEKLDLWGLLESTKAKLDRVLSPDGYNIGLNLGRAAGAGFPGHLHFHIVPRWAGDVNFMPVVASTKVISQSLFALHKLLNDTHPLRNRRQRK